MARLIGAEPETLFTSGRRSRTNPPCGGRSRGGAQGRHLVVSAIEHPAVLEPARHLQAEGFEVTVVAAGADGIVATDEIARALRPDTTLVSVMAANNEIGTVQEVAEIGRLCRERGILFHSDAVQAIGRLPFHVEKSGTDLVSISAHKMYGPKGVGALYVRRARRPRIRLQPQAEGGGQEKGLRSGTLNVPGIVGLGEAARLASEAIAAGEPERIAALRDRLLAGLRARISGVEVNGSMQRRLPGNLHVSIARAEAETLILSLGGRIAISSGAACAEAGGKGSHVLRAVGLSDERVYTALRFGIGRFNDVREIDESVEALAVAVDAARARAAATPR